MRGMKLAIIGSHVTGGRDWEQGVRNYISARIKLWMPDRVISGGAPCVDTWAIEIADSWGYQTDEIRPEVYQWEDRDGKKGYRSRNVQIVNECTHLLRLGKPQRGSGGSAWTMSRAIQDRKPTTSVIIAVAGHIHSEKKYHHFPAK